MIVGAIAASRRRSGGGGPTIQYHGAGTWYSANTTTHNIAYPSGIASGDVLILVIGNAAGVATSAPTGWTSLDSLAYDQDAAGTAPKMWTMGREADGTESGSLSLTTGSAKTQAVILRFSGVDWNAANPILATDYEDNATSGPFLLGRALVLASESFQINAYLTNSAIAPVQSAGAGWTLVGGGAIGGAGADIGMSVTCKAFPSPTTSDVEQADDASVVAYCVRSNALLAL